MQYLNQTWWMLKEEKFPLLSVRTHLQLTPVCCCRGCDSSTVEWGQWLALKCQTCLSELRHFLEQVDRCLCWVSIKKQAQSSMLICTGSQRGPPLIACPVSESYLLSGLLENVETIIRGSVIVVLIQLLLWKSVGTFYLSLWELSPILHQYTFGAVSLDHGNA